ncbi:protein phosphatase regulator, partial [Spiromyces aspiralis]
MPSRILRALLIDTSEEALRHHPYLLLPRVDYFYHTWDDLAFGSNWFMLRKVYPEEINEWDPDPALKLRCLNVLWRRWTARLFNLQKFPPENINWNKDADLTFLYGPVCDPDPPLPFDHEPPPVNIVAATSHRPTRSNSTSGLKSVLKRPSSFINMLRAPASGPILSVPLQRSATDLAQYHRPNTLLLSSAPTSRCITPPSWAPPPPHPPPIYLSATKSADPLPQSLDRPRLRFNSRVEQCMVVFSDEEELLPTDIDDDDDDDDDDDTYVYDDSGHPERNLPNGSLLICSSDPSSEVPESQLCTKAAVPHDSLLSADEQPLRSRHSIIIKLEPTTLKGEDIRARKIPGALARTQSYYDAADIDDFDLGEFSDLVPDYNIVFSSAEDSRHHHSRNASDSGMFSLSPPSDGP